MQRWPDDTGPFEITFTWKVIDGRIECDGIHITSTDDAVPVPEGIWRDLQLGQRMRRARAEMTAEAIAGAPATPTRGMRRSTRERLVEAARVYEAAFNAGRRDPTKAVQEHFGMTEGGASSLVSRARAAGLLPPTSPGAPHA